MVRDPASGKYRPTRLFVMTLGYSCKSVRLLVFHSSSRIWAELHEKAFRRLTGATRLVVLDNLREGVLSPDVYDPALNPLYRDVLRHYYSAADVFITTPWYEPFGITPVEAMACGTPVIAYNRGSVAEIVEDGHTGFVVEDEISAVAAVGRLGQLNRHEIRQQFEARFTARRMALDYLSVYRSLMETAEPRIKLVSSAE